MGGRLSHHGPQSRSLFWPYFARVLWRLAHRAAFPWGIARLSHRHPELGEGGVDLVFLDAVKTEYPEYLPHARRLLRPGGLLVADNVIGSTAWWIDDPEGSNPSRDGADRMVAGDAGFEACCLPIREGVLVARRH